MFLPQRCFPRYPTISGNLQRNFPLGKREIREQYFTGHVVRAVKSRSVQEDNKQGNSARCICHIEVEFNTFSFPEPTTCSVSGGIVGSGISVNSGVNFTTFVSVCLIFICACSILVRGALGRTILVTTEKFEFLSIES